MTKPEFLKPGRKRGYPVYCYVVLVNELGQIYVAKRNPDSENRPNAFDLFGGCKEKMKDITKKRAAKREVAEETGLVNLDLHKKLYDEIVTCDSKIRRAVAYATLVSSEIKIKFSPEHIEDGSGWVNAEEFEKIKMLPFLKDIGLCALSQNVKVKLAA